MVGEVVYFEPILTAADLEKTIKNTVNHDNFWALLVFRVKSVNSVLKEHLASIVRNVMSLLL